MKTIVASLALVLLLGTAACGDEEGTTATPPTVSTTVDQTKTKAACDALANEPTDPYNAAVDEWNAHQQANDATYRRYTNSGGFAAWAKAAGKPTQPDPNAGKADDAADQVAVDAAGGPLAVKVKAAQAAASRGDLPAATTAGTEIQLICSSLGVTIK